LVFAALAFISFMLAMHEPLARLESLLHLTNFSPPKRIRFRSVRQSPTAAVAESVSKLASVIDTHFGSLQAKIDRLLGALCDEAPAEAPPRKKQAPNTVPASASEGLPRPVQEDASSS
jgi:hypothetical protein